MAKLILSLDGSVIREVPLDRESVTIGRKPHNDIQIENLAVSGEHARVTTVLNDSFLEDLDSTNGTLVNGSPVKKHILQHNDVIEIGKYRLKYLAEAATPAASAAAAEDLEKTMVVRAGARGAVRPVPEAPAAPAPPPAPAPSAPAAAVRILNGPGAGKELEFTKNVTTLGKPGVQVAAIMRRPQGYFIAHVEGASFPAVNGALLDAQPRALNDHDTIDLAGVKMEFFLKAK